MVSSNPTSDFRLPTSDKAGPTVASGKRYFFCRDVGWMHFGQRILAEVNGIAWERAAQETVGW